jgi:hypothetical protein
MRNMTLKETKYKKAKEPKINFSKNIYAPKKTVSHQTKNKLAIVIHKGFYSWKYKTLMKKEPEKNMKRKKLKSRHL